MSFWTRLRSWTSATVRSSRMERNMDDEMRFHVEAHATELMKRGVPKDQALRQA